MKGRKERLIDMSLECTVLEEWLPCVGAPSFSPYHMISGNTRVYPRREFPCEGKVSDQHQSRTVLKLSKLELSTPRIKSHLRHSKIMVCAWVRTKDVVVSSRNPNPICNKTYCQQFSVLQHRQEPIREGNLIRTPYKKGIRQERHSGVRKRSWERLLKV